MKKILFVFLIILCQIGVFASIYSEKTNVIPDNFVDMNVKPILLNGADNENTQTLLKVMHTNNEIFIGVNCFDTSIINLDKNIPNEEKLNYDKDRVDILICKKYNTNYYAHYIVSPGGIVYDSYGKDKGFNNKYNLVPKINSTGWEFILVIDRKSLTNGAFVSDDWLIKVIRKSNRENIKFQGLRENLYDWTELYFNSDEEAFKYFEQKLPFKIKELESDTYPESLKIRFKNSIEEINKLKENKNRDSLNKINSILDYNMGTINNYIGANQQKPILNLKEPLPFVFSFIDCNSKYKPYYNKFINKLSYNIKAVKGSNVSFGVILSSYEDVNKVEMSYEGDMIKNVSLGYIDKINDFLDPIVSFNSNKLNFTNIKCGETVILFIEFKNVLEGNNKGNIIVKYNDNVIKLPVKIDVFGVDTPKLDKVIAQCSFNDKVYKNTLDSDFTKYLNSVSKICKFLVENHIYSVSFNIEDICSDSNMFNGRKYDLLLKTIFLSGINNLYIEPLNDISLSKSRNIINEIISVNVTNNKKDNVFIMISDDNKKNSDYQEFKENVNERINLYDIYCPYSFSLEESPLSCRMDMWEEYYFDNKLLVPFNIDEINNEYYISHGEFGFGTSSLVYYKNLNDDFIINSSLRLKSLCDGIDDINVLDKFIKKIQENKSANNSSEVVKGEAILQQFKDLTLSKSPEIATGNEFNTMKDKMIDYIK